MPLYSANTTRHPGARPWPYMPCYGVDANGLDIGNNEAVDTDSGECWYFEKDATGSYVTDESGNDFRVLCVKYAPPILFFPEKRGV